MQGVDHLNTGLTEWLAACTRQISERDRNVANGFIAARDRLLQYSGGACTFMAADPTKVSSVGIGDLALSGTTFRFFNLQSSTECHKVTDRKTNAGEVVFHWLTRGEVDVEQNGRHIRVHAGQIFVVGLGSPTTKHWRGDCELLIVLAHKADLQRALLDEAGAVPNMQIDFNELAVIDIPTALALTQFIGTVISDMSQSMSVFKDDPLARQAERTLNLLLLKSLKQDGVLHADARHAGPAPYYIRRVENYLRDHLEQAVTMAEMAEAAGVSVRTLYYGFKEYRDASPMKYLKAIRLAEARNSLLSINPANARIGEIALQCGYQSLSQFSRDYRNQFGESASATLKRG